MANQTFDGVLALGGFVAASVMPGIVRARRSGKVDGFNGRVVLLNLDRVPGKANRQIARKADVVLTAVDTVRPGFASMTTGLPIRSAAMASEAPSQCRSRLGLEPDRTTLLVTGASQGASSLNRLMLRLVRSHTKELQSLQIIHLGGQHSRDELQKAYDSAGIHAVVEPFIHEMGLAWGALPWPSPEPVRIPSPRSRPMRYQPYSFRIRIIGINTRSTTPDHSWMSAEVTWSTIAMTRRPQGMSGSCCSASFRIPVHMVRW